MNMYHNNQMYECEVIPKLKRRSRCCSIVKICCVYLCRRLILFIGGLIDSLSLYLRVCDTRRFIDFLFYFWVRFARAIRTWQNDEPNDRDKKKFASELIHVNRIRHKHQPICGRIEFVYPIQPNKKSTYKNIQWWIIAHKCAWDLNDDNTDSKRAHAISCAHGVECWNVCYHEFSWESSIRRTIEYFWMQTIETK